MTSRMNRVVLVGAVAAVLGLGAVAVRGLSAERTDLAPEASAPATGPPPAAAPRAGPAPRSGRLPSVPTAKPSPPDTDPTTRAFGGLLGSPQTDPRQPDYDPVAAYQLGGEGNVMRLFDSEPRDEAWASEREADISSFLRRDMQAADPEAILDVECRTATCRLRRRSPTAQTDSLGNYPLVCLATRTTPLWGTARDTAPDAEPYDDYFLVFDRATRDRDGFFKRRGATCADFREKWRRVLEESSASEPPSAGP